MLKLLGISLLVAGFLWFFSDKPKIAVFNARINKFIYKHFEIPKSYFYQDVGQYNRIAKKTITEKTGEALPKIKTLGLVAVSQGKEMIATVAKKLEPIQKRLGIEP